MSCTLICICCRILTLVLSILADMFEENFELMPPPDAYALLNSSMGIGF